MDRPQTPPWRHGPITAESRFSPHPFRPHNEAMSFSELRRYRRANVDSGHLIQFKALGRFFLGLPVVTVGAGGCCVQISTTLAGDLKPDTPLSRILIQHPELPNTLLEGRISWIRGRQPGVLSDIVEMGIEFQDPDPAFVEVVDAYILKLLKEA